MQKILQTFLLLGLSFNVFGQNTIFSSQILPDDGDQIYLDYFSKYITVDGGIPSNYEFGTNVTWDLSGFDNFGKKSCVYEFAETMDAPSQISNSNLRVCMRCDQYNGNSYGIEASQYWNVSDSSWSRVGKIFINDNLSECDEDTAISGHYYTNFIDALRFPLDLNSIWEEDKDYTTFRFINSTNSFENLSNISGKGFIAVKGLGSLITPDYTVDDCYLIYEYERQKIGSDSSIYQRWMWVKQFVKWPIMEIEEITIFDRDAMEGEAKIYTEVAFQRYQSDEMLGSPNKEELGREFELYPNPSYGVFSLSQPLSGMMKVIAMNGQVLITEKVQNQSSFDLTRLTPGTYILEFSDREGNSEIKKIVLLE